MTALDGSATAPLPGYQAEWQVQVDSPEGTEYWCPYSFEFQVVFEELYHQGADLAVYNPHGRQEYTVDFRQMTQRRSSSMSAEPRRVRRVLVPITVGLQQR